MIKKVTKKQTEQGATLLLRIACQKALDKLNKYFNKYLGHGYLSTATICDLQFNFNVFGQVFKRNKNDNTKQAKLKSHFKTCFYQYQDCETGIKHARFVREQTNVLDLQEDEVEEEESDAELYQKGLIELDTKTKLNI